MPSAREWGNVVRSVRDTRVATVSEYLRSVPATRFPSSAAVSIATSERSWTPATVPARSPANSSAGPPRSWPASRKPSTIRNTGNSERVDVETLAADVTTVFLNQRGSPTRPPTSTRFVQGRISPANGPRRGRVRRHVQDELLDYVELISADVSRHAPGIAATLECIEGGPRRALADPRHPPGLTEAGTERSPGRPP